MADFSTSAELDVVVNDSSLRSAKQEIEDELRGAASVNATASNQLRSDGGTSVGGWRGITGLIKSQQQTNQLTEENLSLNETRNEILRDLLDETEGSGGGGGGNLLRRFGSLGALLGGGLALGGLLASALGRVNWTALFSDALPSLAPSDLLDPVQTTAGDLIAEAASISPGALIAEAASLSPAALIASKISLDVSDLIESPVDIGAGTLLDALIASPVVLTASQVLDHLVDSGSGSGATDPTTDPAPSENPSYSGASQTHSEILGDQSGSGAGFADRVREGVTDPRNIGMAAGAGAGAALLATAPISAPAAGAGVVTAATLTALASGSAAAQSSDGGRTDYRPSTTNPWDAHARSYGYESSMTSGREPPQHVSGTRGADDQLRVNVNVNETTEIDASSLRQTERQIEQKMERMKDDIMREVERELSGGGY